MSSSNQPSVNATVAPRAAGAIAPAPRSGLTGNQLFGLALLSAALLSGLSLIFVYAIDFDPSGWVVYGREVFGPGVLDTSSNPAWKPFPIIVDGLFSLISRGEAGAYFWLFCARTLGLLLVFGTARLAYRYGGRWAAALAALLMLTSPWWVSSTVIAQDGPPTAAFAIGGILAYQRGWVRAAGICAVCASLLRPEAAPFAAVFGLWAWHNGRLTIWELVVGAAVIAGLWLVPTILHTGYSPGTIASKGGVKGTAIRAKIPFLAVLSDSEKRMLAIPSALVVIACAASLVRLRWAGRVPWLTRLWGRDHEEQAMLAGAMAWLLIVAVETIAGFSGNTRYAIPAFAIFTVVAPVVAVRLAQSSRRIAPALVAVACVATAVLAILPLRQQHKLILIREHQMTTIKANIRALHCPGHVWANHQNNAYVAMLVDESLPASVIDNPVLMRRSHHSRQIAYCAPAGWQPSH